MAIIDQRLDSAAARPAASPAPAQIPPVAGPAPWANAAPLGLAAFAVTTFILSMINIGAVNVGVEPVAFAVAFMYGGLVQLIAGLICLRNGNTFTGVLFSTFGAFWLSFYALAEFFLKSVPPAEVGHALGMFLFAFSFPTAMLLLASFRTNIVVVVAIADLLVTLVLLGAGYYWAIAGLHTAGGWLGLVAGALAIYLALAETCEFTYGRAVLPIGPLARR